MQFNSYIFVFAFLPLMVILYFIFNRISLAAGKCLLIAASAVFYIYAGAEASLVLFASVAVNYVFSRLVTGRARHKKLIMGLAVAANVACLLYFKYCNFFIDSINSLFRQELPLQELVVPVGISFFTFQQILYVVNAYRGNVEVRLFDYLAYILYFPKMLMGPITEPSELIAMINDPALKRVNWDNIASGLKMFSFGLFKKAVLADTFAKAVTWGFSNFDKSTSLDWILLLLCYCFEVYFDFSGYTDMATGVSLMLNIKLPMNFDSPFRSTSIRNFWKRWHLTLTAFFTKYVYFPMGGSRKGRPRAYLNTIVVFMISGFWHGASLNFIIWGALHGVIIVLEKIFERPIKKIPVVLQWICALFLIIFTRIFFITDSVQQAGDVLAKVFSFESMELSEGFYSCFDLTELGVLVDQLQLGAVLTAVPFLWMLVFMIGSFLLCMIPKNNYRNMENRSFVFMVLAAAALVWGILCLGTEAVFIYNQF